MIREQNVLLPYILLVIKQNEHKGETNCMGVRVHMYIRAYRGFPCLTSCVSGTVRMRSMFADSLHEDDTKTLTNGPFRSELINFQRLISDNELGE